MQFDTYQITTKTLDVMLHLYHLNITAVIFLAQFLAFCTRTDAVHSPNDERQVSWSGLSDILEINELDPSWQDDAQSGPKENATSSQKNEGGKGKTKQIRIRTSTPEQKQLRKIERQRIKDRINSDPVAKDNFKKKKALWNKTYKARRMLRMTESERNSFQLHKKQANHKYNMLRKEKCGGYSCPKMQRLSEIRKLQVQGKANEEDLKYLQDYRDEQRLIRRKQRAAQKGGSQRE